MSWLWPWSRKRVPIQPQVQAPLRSPAAPLLERTLGEEMEIVRCFIGLTEFRVNFVLPIAVQFTGKVAGLDAELGATWPMNCWQPNVLSLRDKLTWAAITIKAAGLKEKEERDGLVKAAEKAAMETKP